MSFLPELVKAYEKLPVKPPFGYEVRNISYCIILKDNGHDFEIVDIRQIQNNKAFPVSLVLPASPPRTINKTPFFLWDNIDYVFGGYRLDGKTSEIQIDQQKTAKNRIFKEKHLEFLAQYEQFEIKAFCNFIKSWQPDKVQLAKLYDFIRAPDECVGNFVFAHENTYRERYLHENPVIEIIWSEIMNNWNGSEEKQGICFLSGDRGAVSRTHPKILGVAGANPTGSTLISFNEESFNSFGRKQGYNVPISKRSTHYYSTALNAFLKEKKHNTIIGNTTMVYWASSPTSEVNEKAVSIFSELVDPREEESLAGRQVKNYLQAIRRGAEIPEQEFGKSVRFFVLGLVPNNSRIAVQFYWQGNFGHLVTNFQRYLSEIKVSDDPSPSIYQIVLAQAVLHNKRNIIQRMVGDLLNSILAGTPYPLSLLKNSIIRIRSDGQIRPARIAVMKAILTRNYEMEVPMALDRNFTDRGYVLGRLFAVYEHIQRRAIGNVNSSIKDKFYGLASASPQQAFRVLDSGAQKHLAKIRRAKKGSAIYFENEVGQIMELMDPNENPIPVSLNLTEQAMFGIGYYHQHNSFYMRKENSNQPEGGSDD